MGSACLRRGASERSDHRKSNRVRGLQLGFYAVPHSQQISRAMAAALKSAAGQGPERVRTYINADVVTVVVERSLTPVESSVAASADRSDEAASPGGPNRVREEVIPEVESFTGRKVLTCLSDHAIEPDVGVYTFILDSSE